ncbi:MAG: choice-of-anchor D domain-containing protein [Candidatus Sulfotelmatobacter sp.]
MFGTDRTLARTNYQQTERAFFGWSFIKRDGIGALPFLLSSLLVLSACGGGSSSSQPPGVGSVAGNWQFTMATPSDNSFQGGLLGGFLLQANASVTGAATYSITLTQGGGSICNSGSAPITGTISGQGVTLTAVAGNQTFTLSGGLSADGSTMMGTYNSTDGNGCGTAQTGLQWSAISVPQLTGAIQGNFHSSANTLRDQDFPVSGVFTQGPNIGASKATVTGTLTFQDYPCLASASVNGQISGNSVILQIIASNGLNVGQIGAPPGFANPSPVTFQGSSGAGGAVLQGASGYGITTKACSGGTVAGDIGNVCLAVGNPNGCSQPILLSPALLTFPAQQVGSAPTAQTITLTNTGLSGTPLNGLSLLFNPQSKNTSLFGVSDFDQLPNFTEQDNCVTPAGSSFSLAPQQSCSITISFSPQQSCPWLPSISLGGEPSSLCPFPLGADLTVKSPSSADSDTSFAVPISGTGFSAIVPSTPEVDFGAEALNETSAPQLLSFTNQGAASVQILPALNSPCVNVGTGVLTLPRPPAPGLIAGLQVTTGTIARSGSTISYNCDSDLTSKLPNFQISADDCSGTLLAPQASCSLQLTFAPQPSTPLAPALDYFLQLNTLQCNSATTVNCEIDSGRFPVELTANLPSTLRMTPGAGLDFGTQTRGQTSAPQTITLFNDPNDPKAAVVNFTGNIVTGDYAETDNCGASLAPGSSCTMNVTFQPRVTGFDPGTITITYTVGQTQTVHLRGTGQ